MKRRGYWDCVCIFGREMIVLIRRKKECKTALYIEKQDMFGKLIFSRTLEEMYLDSDIILLLKRLRVQI